jgi:hypothetical protein
LPQHRSLEFPIKAHECVPPIDKELIFESKLEIGTNTKRCEEKYESRPSCLLSPRPRQYTAPESAVMHKCCEPQPADKIDGDKVALGNLPVTLKMNDEPASIEVGRIVMSVFELDEADDNTMLLEDSVIARFKGYDDEAFLNNWNSALNGAAKYCGASTQPTHSKK